MTAKDAPSAAKALDMLRASPCGFDIVILDLMMPEMDGFDLAREIKADTELSHLKLILLSSFGKGGHSEAALEIGIAEFLHKPVRQSQIYNCLLKVANGGGNGTSSQKGMPDRLRLNAVTDDSTAPAVSNLRILVAEDNDINMEVARNQLRSLGYTAHFVHNGQEAVDAAKREPYDVILMDCQMPDKDGFEATAEIREFEGAGRHTTIVAVTAHALEGDSERCLAAGMDDYLGKPVKIEALRNLLEAWTPEAFDPAEWPEELSVADDETVFDRKVLASYEELQQPGEPDLVVKLIDLFMNRSSASIICLKRAAAEGDMAEIVLQAHGLKGSSGNIGARQVAELSSRLGVSDGPANAIELAAELERAFEAAGEILLSIKVQRQKGKTQP